MWGIYSIEQEIALDSLAKALEYQSFF